MINDRWDPSSNSKLAVALLLPCVTVATAVLSKHTLFCVVCDDDEIMDNEAVSFVLEFTRCVSGGLLLGCCVVVACVIE